MSDLVSVIVPAYNASSRLRPCLESIIAQDYGDMEIIVVDDKSQDGTGDIAREILGASARKHKVITHKLNSGECASRNTGLKHAEGKYVCFIDADDLVRGNFISLLHEAVTRGKCEMSFCGLTDRFMDGKPDKDIHSVHDVPYISSGEKFILDNSVPPVWCCMYDAEFLRKYNLMFHEGCTAGGDVEFITKALCRAERVTFVMECLYIYMHHEDMGSVRDNDTKEKKLLRYEHNTQAQCSTAEYLCEHAASQELKDFAGKVLLPHAIIRKFTVHSMSNDYEGYNAFLRDSRVMMILRGAVNIYTLRKKAEVFLKALMILYFPGFYYRMRCKA